MHIRILTVFLIVICLLTVAYNPTSAQAPTFGPICEGTTAPGVTCVPPSPTLRPTAIPTAVPQPPASGTAETTLALLGISGLFLVAGVSSLLLSRRNRNVVK